MPAFVSVVTLLLPSLLSAAQSPPTAAQRDSLARVSLQAIRQRAQAGDSVAQFRLATALERGYGDILPIDSAKAEELYRLSAESGYAPAQNYIGFIEYNRGNTSVAIDWLMKAADSSDPKAFNNLGWMLMEGEGVEHDYDKARYWLTRAAESGLPVALIQLGDLYRCGLGVEPDTIKARTLYDAAIAAGHIDAQNKLLAMMHDRYKQMPVTETNTLGKYYLAMGATTVAVTLFELGAAANDPLALALLGNAYSRGEGVEYSHAKSLEYFFRAAEGGNPSAQYVLGELLEMFPDSLQELPENLRSHITPQMQSAAYWLEQAAAGGVKSAHQATEAILGE